MTRRGWIIGSAVAIAGIAAGGAAFVRLAPTRPAEWDVDPAREGRTGPGRHLIAEEGDAPPLQLAAPPGMVLDALSEIAAEEGGTRIVWRPDDGRATWEVRSRVMGFPDYVSVRAVPAGGGTVLTAYSRLRYGADDMGVNEDRLNRWTAALKARLPG
ncbi:uncharacterized protein DUF1499 [Hasllibacter halocynthiae]|uniref:Uncharacterized protein DUF1499 n=1 Tax=Hasllibacter halocynthiae TaxID=595589 RepID=A0A2T0X7N6_9RHOB|nr:DUF1499 domain-containing protein [Hasllibacter halocynthiae]PRY94949.1 uncharacterized protein DUF1499 [Hasllibacter halocynthiae]